LCSLCSTIRSGEQPEHKGHEEKYITKDTKKNADNN
jgi:hypothetical protein